MPVKKSLNKPVKPPSVKQIRANRATLCKALKSGKFEQGKKKLYSRGKYCCLGVAKKIFGLKKAEDGCELLHSEQAKAVLGLDFYAQNCLAGHNDGDGYIKFDADFKRTLTSRTIYHCPHSFEQIAKIIPKLPIARVR